MERKYSKKNGNCLPYLGKISSKIGNSVEMKNGDDLIKSEGE